jgi:hypothetical protein
MWNDVRFRALSPAPPSAQFLWLRLLTAPELGVIPGLLAAREGGLADALGWPLGDPVVSCGLPPGRCPQTFREAFGEVFALGLAKADWKAGLVWVPNAIRHNPPASPNVVSAWANSLVEAPECALKVEAIRDIRAFLEAFGEGFRKAFADISPYQEQEQEQDPPLASLEGGGAPPAAPALAPMSEVRSRPASKRVARPEADGGPTLLGQEGSLGASTDGPCGPPSHRHVTKRPGASSKGTRLSPDWRPKPETIEAFRTQGIDALAAVPEFVDHWAAIPGSKGCKLDWEATFRNRVRQLVDWGRAPRIAGGTAGSTGEVTRGSNGKPMKQVYAPRQGPQAAMATAEESDFFYGLEGSSKP